MKYYIDEKGYRHVLPRPIEDIRFIEDDAELEREMNEPIRFEEVTKRLIGILFNLTLRKTLDRL